MFLAISPIHSTTHSAAHVPSAQNPPTVVQHATPPKRVPQPTMHDDEFDRIVASMLRTIDSSPMNPILSDISTDTLTDDEFDEIICSLGKSVFGETPTSDSEMNALGILATTGDEAPILFLHGGASERIEIGNSNEPPNQNDKPSVVVRKTINNPLIDKEERKHTERIKRELKKQGYSEDTVESLLQTTDRPKSYPANEPSIRALKQLNANARRKPKP